MQKGNNVSKQLPHDTDAEEAFLGALLINPAVVNEGVILLKPEYFFHPPNAIIFKAIRDLYNASIEIDPITLSSHLKDHNLFKKAGGDLYINKLLDATPASSNIKYYSDIINDKSILRNIIKASEEINELAFDETKDVEDVSNEAEQKLFDVTDRNISKTYEDIQPIVNDTIKIIMDFKNSNGFPGLETGFSEFDKETTGLMGGQFIVIGGRPGSGKTAFCLNLAANVATKTNRPVLFFSLEMQKTELVMRMLCSEAQIDSRKLKLGMMNKRDNNNLITAANSLYKTQIVIDDKANITVMEARAKARRIKKEKGDLALIIFDYIQLVEGPPGIDKGNRYAIISEVSRSLKYLAKELDVPVIGLSQLSRKVEDRGEKVPMLSDLRESGQIEQDADIIAFIHRDFLYSHDKADEHLADLFIRKNRSGSSYADIPLAFFGSHTRFEDRARSSQHE